jgi:hypothetical protein
VSPFFSANSRRLASRMQAIAVADVSVSRKQAETPPPTHAGVSPLWAPQKCMVARNGLLL